MELRRWSWLIGYGEASDTRLLQWARSYASPPSVEVSGGTVAPEAYAPERRAIRLRAAGRSLTVRLTPNPVLVNPVLEVEEASEGPLAVSLDGRGLDPARFAWDGRRLWIEATLERPARLELVFGQRPPR
jgi:hypothetical protein